MEDDCINKFIKEQALTPGQYRRANLIMCLILAVSYFVYIIVEIINVNKFGMPAGLVLRCILYAAMIILSAVTFRIFTSQKKSMQIYALSYLITFAFLIFGNGVVVMVMAFPALIGFMIYLNSILIGVECIASLIICVVKCIILFNDGNMELLNYGVLICAGLIVGIFGAYITILLLIDFSKEDRAAIENEAEHRAQVTCVVEGIIAKLDTDFRDVANIYRTLM